MFEIPSHITNIERKIIDKVYANKRIETDEAIFLYENSSLSLCAILANHIKTQKFDKNVFYNKNTHLEISNRCVNKCKFCSFYREKGDPECWDLEIVDVINILSDKKISNITEVHITGGLHPDKKHDFFCSLFSEIKRIFPNIHIKAFTAVEIEYFAKSGKTSELEILQSLKKHGLNSLAGGGAEILNDDIRKILCPEKTNSETWLRVHKLAHNCNLSSNCTMLYGHIESFADRVSHMNRLRILQDETNGFNCFIPLKYKNFGNSLNLVSELSTYDELKNYAIARIFLDNIPHIKAYWPMCGKETAALSLSFGVDDIDGTISNSTKIYSMAGSCEQKPEMNESEICSLISKHGYIPTERDSHYNILFS